MFKLPLIGYNGSIICHLIKEGLKMRVNGDIAINYQQLSSMQRINSASDDAAGLAISQKLESQSRGLDKGTDNALDMSNLLNTAEGSLDSIHDSLHRMRELSVKASNGILSNDDKTIIQDEINQLKSSIADTVKNTQFNTIKLLDGTFTNKNTATNPSGTGTRMNIKNTGLSTLGIENFDVTEDFNIGDLDKAIEMVSSARSDIGSSTNRLNHTISYNNNASYNQIEANSRIRDLDFEKGIMNLKRNEIMQQYKFFAQKQSMTQGKGVLNLLS